PSARRLAATNDCLAVIWQPASVAMAVAKLRPRRTWASLQSTLLKVTIRSDMVRARSRARFKRLSVGLTSTRRSAHSPPAVQKCTGVRISEGERGMLREVSSAEELLGPRGEFLGTLAHELRSTLGLIRVYAATLLAPDAPRDEATLRHCLSGVVDASADVEALLNQVLDLSKAAVGALDIEPRPVRLTPLVRMAIGRARIRTPRHTLLLD